MDTKLDASGFALSRRRAGGERREKVLRQVIAVIAERGYDRTRFADVAKVSGVAVSTLQFYFGSREDMLVEALHRSIEEEVQTLESSYRPESSPWERLVALVDRGLDPTALVTGKMLLEFWHASARDPQLRAVGAYLCQRYRQPFIDAIRAGVDHGSFRTKDEPEDVATVLNGILEGLIIPRVLEHEYYHVQQVRGIVMRTLAGMLDVATPVGVDG